jgi:hypothetical protein
MCNLSLLGAGVFFEIERDSKATARVGPRKILSSGAIHTIGEG